MITALAPIDGYTDCAFRELVKKYSNPDFLFTEFVNAQGLTRATEKLVPILRYSEFQRPIIAQLFGCDPKCFYEATLLCLQLGFDGIDINMGCPARKIASKGGGVGLIKTPKLAVEIIKAVRKGREDYRNKKSASSKQLSAMDKKFSEVIDNWNVKVDQKRKITVSAKTRMGYDSNITEEWIGTLANAKPDFITLHGRTFKQGFKGNADWDAIKRAVQSTDIPIIGNGDVKNYDDAKRMEKETGCWGVMVGRGSFGKPWVLQQSAVSYQPSDIKKVALEHAKLYVKFKGETRFYELRKHLLAYFKGFKGAKELRVKIARVNNNRDLRIILK